MRSWILISDLFENKIYLLPVRSRVFEVNKVGLIAGSTIVDVVVLLFEGHEGRSIRFLLNHIAAATSG